jgi:hypothetical protein
MAKKPKQNEPVIETTEEIAPINSVQTQHVTSIDPNLLLKKMISKGPNISKSLSTKKINTSQNK